ncbi:uncharacterized protein LOC129773478 isoform X2 [Toxorhynchites rutilus septentrionalis]|uniref:uncharacterized protein LOC129773478 isoform X2 n=1 Tax=Toxorhynchites rutilus septentrionalis TaxID=329112 RepID=UPI00247A8C0B|nr:uncharacterized protein LOC129773478 isoform X2 [Toxorhynchites rutilus septentrionalis]
MSKRKPSFLVGDVLPDDQNLNTRSGAWRTMMEKYSKTNETESFDLATLADKLDYESDESPVSDVESGGNEDSDQENREEINRQLQHVVSERKRTWERTGLHELMASIEDPSQRFNMLSHEKVENWLFNRSAGTALEMTQGKEMRMSEKNEDGDRVRFHRKQQVTVSSKDDEDSLYSVDTAKYILSNKNRKNNSYSKIKVTTMIKQYTVSANNTTGTFHPKLHSISSFPAIEEERSPSASVIRQISKSDSAFEAAEEEIRSRCTTKRPQPLPSIAAVSTAEPDKGSRRKKVFKKTIKKRANPRRSPIVKDPVSSLKFDQALQSAMVVKKVPLVKAKQKRIHWKETSYLEKSEQSSSDEADDDVFVQAKPKPKPKTPPKREIRRKPVQRLNESSEKEQSPSKKVSSAQKKIVEKELVEPFESICLSPTKARITRARAQLDFTNQNDQTTNMTALFSGANDKITNSTEINNTTASTTMTNMTSSSRGRRRNIFPDQSRCLVIFEPKKIQQDTSGNERIRITMADLKLDRVTKPRHLEKFKKFSCVIHPNSSVRFFPSDSEEDDVAPALSIPTSISDEDESFDEDDPILTYNPRNTDRLNVMECPYDP